MNAIYYLCLFLYFAKYFQTAKPNNVCKPMKEDIAFGRILYDRNTARLHCYKGYRPVFSRVAICKKNGQWSNRNLSCEAVRCKISSLSNGKWVATRKIHSLSNKMILYALCKSGYTLTGSVTSTTCLSNGSWSQHDAKCIVKRDVNFYFVVASVCTLLGAGILLTAAVFIYFVKEKRRYFDDTHVFNINSSATALPTYQECHSYSDTNPYRQNSCIFFHVPIRNTTDYCYSMAETLPLGEDKDFYPTAASLGESSV